LIRFVLLIFLAVSVSGCGIICSQEGTGDVPEMVRHVDPVLESYVGRFESEFKPINYGVKVTVIGNAAGICYKWSTGERKVDIDTKSFNDMNEDQREELIYHELAHCSLGRNHKDSTTLFADVPGVWPASVMRTYAFSISEASTYMYKRDYYINELRQ
jgi:hypothetical protein